MAILKTNNSNIKTLCKVAQVSRSGYYQWLKNRENQSIKDNDDLKLISYIFDKKHKKAGWRTIKMILEHKYSIIMNHKKIRRIKNQYGLNTKIRRKSQYRAVFKKHQESCVCPNILKRKFNPDLPHKALSTDITYLFYAKKTKVAYLSTIKDLGSKEIIAHKVSNNNNLNLALDTLAKINDVLALESAIIHSDQGVQYTHPIFIKKVKDLKMHQSMSRKGNCLDNAPIESFFGHLKDELDYSSCDTFEELEKKIDEYIYDYNNNRYQWTLKKMTPREYKNHLLIA